MDVNAATVFSAWAAGASVILSLFAFSLSYYTYKRENAKINLNAMIGVMVPGPLDQKYFTITVTNSGRRNVTITKLAGTYFPWWGRITVLLAKNNVLKKILVRSRLFDNNWSDFMLVTTNNIPCQLGEGQYITEIYPADQEMLNGLLRTQRIYAIDSAGNEWYLPRSRLKELQRSIN